ncbi:MAG: HAD hydrolase-like protein [Rhodocyclaceae bacterium]
MSTGPQYRLAIFDFDGTLADSFPVFVELFNSLAAKHRYSPVSDEQIVALRRCGPREVMAALGMKRWRLPFIVADYRRLAIRHPQVPPLFDHMAESLQRIAAGGVQLAIVTTNSWDNVVRSLGEETAALFARAECKVSIFGKHRPLLRVARRLGVAPAQTIYFGDQPTDGQAARRAGMAFGAVAWGYGAPDLMVEQGADHLLQRPEDIPQLFFTG